jgi:deazaflavin-dependent oxidoreductase (nitroreductase family)
MSMIGAAPKTRPRSMLASIVQPPAWRTCAVIRGRRSGRAIRTRVPPFAFKGSRYLVSGGGETDWVRNLRAAGEGELRRGRTSRTFPAVDVRGDEHDPWWWRTEKEFALQHGSRGRRLCGVD